MTRRVPSHWRRRPRRAPGSAPPQMNVITLCDRILVQLRTQALTVGLTTKGPLSTNFGFKRLMFATIRKDAILSQYRQGLRHAWQDSCHDKASSASSGEAPYRHLFFCHDKASSASSGEAPYRHYFLIMIRPQAPQVVRRPIGMSFYVQCCKLFAAHRQNLTMASRIGYLIYTIF